MAIPDADFPLHRPLVLKTTAAARRSLPPTFHWQELLAAGDLGLLLAMRAYDPVAHPGVPFAAYATVRIHGEIIDYARATDHLTRTVRRTVRDYDHAFSHLAQVSRRLPTLQEVASFLDVPLSELSYALRAFSAKIPLDISDILAPMPGYPGDHVDPPSTSPSTHPDNLLVAHDRVHKLHDAVDRLPEPFRTVVAESYFRHRTMRDIATDLGVTESRVSQLRTEAHFRLREILEPTYQRPIIKHQRSIQPHPAPRIAPRARRGTRASESRAKLAS